MELIDFCSDKTSTNIFNSSYLSYFYYNNLVDYMVFTLALNVGDNAYKNTFLSTTNIEEGHKYLITPWDMDMSLGGYFNGEYYDFNADIHRYDGIRPFDRLFNSNIDRFQDNVKEEWFILQKSVLSPFSIQKRLKEYATLFMNSGACEREYMRWNNNPVPLKEDVNEEIDYVYNWYLRNLQSLNKQFTDTRIPDIHNSIKKEDIYMLDGRKVIIKDNLPKGFYIRNGKKFIIK